MNTAFQVGDTIRIIGKGTSGLSIGTIANVVEVDDEGDVFLDVKNKYGARAFYLAKNIERVDKIEVIEL